MYYTLKIPAMSQDLSLRHQFTYQKPDEENGQEYNNIFCVIEVKNQLSTVSLTMSGLCSTSVRSINPAALATKYAFFCSA